MKCYNVIQALAFNETLEHHFAISPINSFPASCKRNHSSLQSRVLHLSSRSLHHPVNLLSRDWKDRSETDGQMGSSWPQSLRPILPASLWAMQAMEWLLLLAVHEDHAYPQIFYIYVDHLQRQKGFFSLSGGLMSSEDVLFCLPSSEKSETKYTISTAICRQQAPGRRGRGRPWSAKEPTHRRDDLSLIRRLWTSGRGCLKWWGNLGRQMRVVLLMFCLDQRRFCDR